MPIPQEVSDLIERFKHNREAYLSSEYNEAQVRLELINPFFKALGWDMYNEASYAEAYKDVVHEDAIKIGGATKAPDYAFRIGGVRKFFVEAKRPGVDIKNDSDPAYQLRRYAWSAKLPLSILTDFEEFAVYDCRIKPNRADKASMARTKYFTYKEYAERWDEIAEIFSREEILKGSFDRYAESAKKKRGTAEVDDAFLKEIETWRDLFARNIALRNPSLSTRELNYAVQRTVDRIIFLRICEDRGIESYGQLRGLQNGTRAYERLCQIFRRADERYNSGLFHFSAEKQRTDPPDDLTLNLAIDDKVLKEIFKGLYYPESPFEFSVLPADILGHIYEQFLGKVIRLTPGHRAKVEDKPEVKKAGGVYYTPTYIVDYIVKNTVGKLLKGNTPTKAAKIRVLDPACGSGSFLLGAYQYLLDWHQEWYAKHDPEKHAKGRNPKLYRTISPSPAGRGQGEGVWRLTTAEKKRILLNNIYGVDIDTQAVEVTKLSLLLKVLEGENAETLGKSLRLFHERALPDLGDNIKCGNSLIGPDFYEGKQLSLLDDEELYRINAFDWEAEFPEIMNVGGFDAVIGNPPYLFLTEVETVFRRYFERRYETVTYRFDLYGAFVEKSASELLGEGGVFGFIIPHTLLSNSSFKALRSLLARNTHLYHIVDIGPGVFAGARNETMLLFFRNAFPAASDEVDVICTGVKQWPNSLSRFAVPQNQWADKDADVWLVRVSADELRLLNRMNGFDNRLGCFCTVNQGLRTGNNEKYLSDRPGEEKWKKAAGGKQISRYGLIPDGLYVFYEPSVLDAPRRPEIFFSPSKIIVQEIRNITLPRRLVATLDVEGVIGLQSTNVINPKPAVDLDIRFILGLLNSAAVNVYFKLMHPGNNHIPSYQLLQIPVAVPKGQRQQHRMVELVETMLKLQKQLTAVKTSHEKTAIQRQIGATDKQIDQLVYELYGLTDKEIRIVEEAIE